MSEADGAPVPLSICCSDYDRTRPVLDGRIAVPGVEPSFTMLNPVEVFRRAFTAEFDVTDLWVSYPIAAIANGDAVYAGIPVFLPETYRHSIIFVRLDNGIVEPDDRLSVRELFASETHDL